MVSDSKSLRWGILATGGIAATFTKDLLIDPKTRNVSDVSHTVVAVASSTSSDRAKQFLEDCKCPNSAKAYGSYEELVNDKNVDVVYVATPHSHHYQNVMLCLLAGKHVLCEKSFTVNAPQTEKLVQTAKEKGLFLMEAVWTRFFPLSIEIRKRISSGEIGPVYRVFADLGLGVDIENKWDDKHRMVNPDLAGGALLDLGIYALTWVFQTLYHTLPESERRQPRVAATCAKYSTGADEATAIMLSFDRGPAGAQYAQGIATTNMRLTADPDHCQNAGPAIRIQGRDGEICVEYPPYRPTNWRIVKRSHGEAEPNVEKFHNEIPGHGMFWEADEVARCIRDGKQQSETMSWAESITIMKVMDEVRSQNDLKYPSAIETLDYPAEIHR